MTTALFQFGKKSKGKKVELPKTAFKFDTKPAIEAPVVLQPIQGKMPQSKEEYWIALALIKMRIPFQFQYVIDSGRRLRGGQVIDFIVQTVPLPTPVYIQGEYWHDTQSAGEDKLKQARARNLFGGQINMPVLIPASTITSVDEAVKILRRVL